MKVAVNGKPFASPQWGGAVRVAWSLVTHLAAVDPGLELDVFVPAPPGVQLTGAIPPSVRIRYSPSRFFRGGLGRSMWEQVGLPAAVRRVGPFVALLNLTNSAPVLRDPGVPQVLLIHDVGFLVRGWFRPGFSAYLAWVLRRAAARKIHAVAVSKASAQSIEQAFPALAPVAVIPNGSDPPPPDAEPAHPGYRYILFLGSRNPRKNLAGAIQGFRRFRAQAAADIRLVVVGMDSDIFVDADLGPPGADVILAGYVSDTDKWSLLRGADALLLPSFLEGFGLPVLEAMQVGTPAVVSDLPVFRELYGDAVEYVDPGSAVSIAAGLLRVHRDAGRRETLRLAGLTRAGRYTWVEAAEGFLDVLKGISAGA